MHMLQKMQVMNLEQKTCGEIILCDILNSCSSKEGA
jgi:hypothetical protein